MQPEDCCILNAGGGSWAFEPLARQLGDALWVDVTEEPRRYNYLLLAEDSVADSCAECFVSHSSMRLAADKRLLAKVFAAHDVPTPETRLVDSLDSAKRILHEQPAREWCLKFPTGCGAAGHRILATDTTLPSDWPLPLVVQEFIRLQQPEVYRLYGAGGRLFGWVARRFAADVKPSPWVAHVRGAHYAVAGDPPLAAAAAARAALVATGLLDSFGCVDLLPTSQGRRVVLEVGTDGIFNHVDREIGDPRIETDIRRNIAEAFWNRLGRWRPWGDGAWHPRDSSRRLTQPP